MRRARLLAWLFVAIAGGCTSGPQVRQGVEIHVEGNVDVSDRLLLRAGEQEIGAFGDDGVRAADAADAAYAMERLLRHEGFAKAQVAFRLEPSEEAPERLVFQVQEGPRITLNEIRYPGGEAIRVERMRALLRERYPLPFSGDRPYRQTDIDEAITAIESMYLLDGYHDVRVGPSEVTFSEDESEADVTIPITEGERYTITRIALEGDVPEEALAEIRATLPRAGGPYHVRVPGAAAGAARAWMRQHGYQDGTAVAERRFHPDEPKVTIAITMELGPRYTIDEITISGLERTDADFAYELLTLERGEIARQSDVNDTIDALYGTGVFHSVDIRAIRDESDGDPLDVDVDFRVVENDARSFELGGGWGSYEQARGWIGYRDRNFTSVARLLEVTAFGSLKGEGIEARVSDRYLLGKQRTLSVSARLETREEPSYDTNSLTLDASIRQPLGPRHAIRYGYQMRFDDTSDLDGRIRGVDEGRSRAAGFYSTVFHDTRDDRLFPTRGDNAELGLFLSDTDVGGDLDFLEYKAVYSTYFPIAHQTVLAIGGRFTTRDVLNDDPSLPIQERLFLGGENTIRSYQQDELGPTDRHNDPQGGLTSAMASVELRRRIWGDLDGALFYEVGTVSPDSWDLSHAAGGAIGTGLRYRLPIGPIRVDFAYNPMHRFAASRKWEIHVSFGFSF